MERKDVNDQCWGSEVVARGNIEPSDQNQDKNSSISNRIQCITEMISLKQSYDKQF